MNDTKKILILYVSHKINDNLIFFCKHGYIEKDNHTFIFILNNPNLEINFLPNKKNVRIINRSNTGIDFGGWTETLFSKQNNKYLYESYDYFVFINSTVRGPFLSDLHKDWTEIFIDKLNQKTKLVGTSINLMGIGQTVHFCPHVQSMFLVTDRIGLDIGIKNFIFDINKINVNKFDTIIKKEMGFSQAILKNGYNIACMIPEFKDIDFTNNDIINSTNHKRLNNCNRSNPFKLIFMKTIHITSSLLLKHTADYNNNNKNLISKVICKNSENQNFDVTGNILKYFNSNSYLRKNLNLNHTLKNKLSKSNKLEFYKDNSSVPCIIVDIIDGRIGKNIILLGY